VRVWKRGRAYHSERCICVWKHGHSWDIALWSVASNVTVNSKFHTSPGFDFISIPVSSDAVESNGWKMKQCWMTGENKANLASCILSSLRCWESKIKNITKNEILVVVFACFPTTSQSEYGLYTVEHLLILFIILGAHISAMSLVVVQHMVWLYRSPISVGEMLTCSRCFYLP
jgi:hypothetical protein